MAVDIPWTFKTWIANFVSVDLPIGNLAKDIQSDSNFSDNDDYYENLDYVACKCKYDREIIDTFRTVWDYFVSSTQQTLSF